MRPDKLPYQLEKGSFEGNQAQRLAQRAASKTNEHVDALKVLNNRVYLAIAQDVATASASFSTLLSTAITTLLPSGYLLITFTTSVAQITAPSFTFFQVLVDGAAVKGCGLAHTAAPEIQSASIVLRVPVQKGTHTVAVQWRVTAPSAEIRATSQVEEHASLLVQEAA